MSSAFPQNGQGPVPDEELVPNLYPPVAASAHLASQPQPEPKGKVRQARDRAQYVRQQKGHSWILHWVFLGVFTLWIVPIYYTFSPNHYWHI